MWSVNVINELFKHMKFVFIMTSETVWYNRFWFRFIKDNEIFDRKRRS